ncbi:phytanoyl-CoA dioxygenase family protein, partial [Mycobacterium kansasii]
AGRYPWTPSAGASIAGDVVEADLAALARDGYVIWENLLSDNECQQIREAVAPMLSHNGRNSFEGHRTQRLYSVLTKTRVCDR